MKLSLRQETRMPSNDRNRRTSAAATVMLMLALAACSNSGSSAAAGVADTTASTAGSVDASAGTPAAGSASASASAGTDPSGATASGAAADACALLPPAEVEAALGVTGLQTTSNPGDDVSYCNYDAGDGTPVAATSYTPTGGSAEFDSYKSAAGAVAVPGVGNAAVVSGGSLYILKGDSLFSFQIAPEQPITPDRLPQIATQIGTSVASRLP
jgi:hypothetical protein